MTSLATVLRALALACALSDIAVAACAPGFGCDTFSDCSLPGPCSTVSCIDHCCVQGDRDCSDDDPCTTDGCTPGVGCVHAPLCPDDGLVCNGTPRCVVVGIEIRVGECRPAFPLGCDTGSKCSIDSCVEPTGCQSVPVNCDDGNPCTTDGCDPATGCSHTPIAGCCRTGAECPTDRCSTRRCDANICGEPMPLSCDDGDPGTIDACDPDAGCTHTRTTTTTAPGSCANAGDCPAGDDPCTLATCGNDHRCAITAQIGFAALACVCDRPSPDACSGETLPRKTRRLPARACHRITAATSATGSRRLKLVKRAETQLEAAEQAAIAAGRRHHLSAACAGAIESLLGDATKRANDFVKTGGQ